MISAIVLAAGESTRMGSENKLLLPFGDKTIIERTVDNLLSCKAHEIVVVLGHQATLVREVLKGRKVKFVKNHRYQEGMTTSIQTGTEAVSSQTSGTMICLSDLPRITPQEFDVIIDLFEAGSAKNEKLIVVPTYEDQRGNPVIFSAYYRSQIMAHDERGGCNGVIKRNPDQVVHALMSTDHVLQDIDTRDEYEKYLDVI